MDQDNDTAASASDSTDRAPTPGAFPVDRPVDALLRDHQLVRQLAEHYRNSDSMAVKAQACTALLQALHTHSRLEESVFYPGVREVAPDMIGHFEDEHQQVDDLLATLQGMQPDEPQSEQMMLEMLDMALRHIQEKEEQFFPMLDQANIDMTPIGLEMAAFEANLIHMQAQGSSAASAS